jgi:hypothetical protein
VRDCRGPDWAGEFVCRGGVRAKNRPVSAASGHRNPSGRPRPACGTGFPDLLVPVTCPFPSPSVVSRDRDMTVERAVDRASFASTIRPVLDFLS